MENGAEKEPADDGARHPHDDVGDTAKPSARHDTSRNGARDQPDDDPRQP
jgi:hypothetical protein